MAWLAGGFGLLSGILVALTFATTLTAQTDGVDIRWWEWTALAVFALGLIACAAALVWLRETREYLLQMRERDWQKQMVRDAVTEQATPGTRQQRRRVDRMRRHLSR